MIITLVVKRILDQLAVLVKNLTWIMEVCMFFGCFIMVKHYTHALSESATLRRGTMQHISIFNPRS